MNETDKAVAKANQEESAKEKQFLREKMIESIKEK